MSAPRRPHRTGRAACVLAAAAIALTTFGALPRAARGDPPGALAAWEAEVEHETEAQSRDIEDARQRKALPSVVSRYANRVSRDPSALNHYLLGRVLYYAQDPVGARNQMTLALQANRDFWYAHLKLAVLYDELKNPAEADRHVRAALEAKPGNLDALRLAAKLAVNGEDLERAVLLLQQLLARKPADLEIREVLARVHMRRKDWDAAAREWRVLAGRDPGNAGVRYLLGVCLHRKGDVDAAVTELEEAVRTDPRADRPLRVLLEIYLSDRYLARDERKPAISAAERLLPLVSGAEQKQIAELLEKLRKGPLPPPVAAEAPKAPTIDQVVAACQDAEVARRRAALRWFHDEIIAGRMEGKPVPTSIRRRISPTVETDWECRAWVVKIEGQLGAHGTVQLARALYDPERSVRALAADTMGEVAHPAALAYLLPLVLRTPEDVDPFEFDAYRAAAARVVGPDAPGDARPSKTREDVATRREEWRRWSLSEASVPAKVAAVRGVAAVGEPTPERFLVDLVCDASYKVFREAFLSLRTAVARPPDDPVERKTFPRFPKVADEELTRPMMRPIQDRIVDWWAEWVAEHRAYLRESGR